MVRPECRGTCGQIPGVRPSRGPGGLGDGRKTCSVCEISIETDAVFCPCCSNRLRFKARHGAPCRARLLGVPRY